MTHGFCSSCGKQLVEDAAFCAACGAVVDMNAASKQLRNASPRLFKRLLPWQVLAAGAVVIAISAVAYLNHKAAEEQDAAISRARSSYSHLSSRLNALKLTQLEISNATFDAFDKARQYYVDTMAASDAGQKRHDEALGVNDLVKVHDYAQQEVHMINDAQTQQLIIETDDAKVLGDYGTLYGDQAVRQFRADLTARNEARDNSVAEWQRAIDLVNDNITENMHSDYAGNSKFRHHQSLPGIRA